MRSASVAATGEGGQLANLQQCLLPVPVRSAARGPFPLQVSWASQETLLKLGLV